MINPSENPLDHNSNSTVIPVEVPTEPARISNLIQRIRESADQLQADRTEHGDLKILSRSIRELRHAFRIFAPYRKARKVTVFGSARTPPTAPAYRQAYELGRQMAAHGWFVVTGAGDGIMHAAHDGAGRAASMGINIMLPFEQMPNPVIRSDPKLVNMKYFFTRKLMFVKECDAMVCLPGGFGTLDETMEVLTLLQTGKREIVPVVLLEPPGETFWTDWLDFIRRHMLHEELISEEDLSLFRITDQVDEAVSELCNFYRVYHSMRFLGTKLVLRLQSSLPEPFVARLNSEFADLLVSGQYLQCSAFPEEVSQGEYPDLPRLAFHFNRRNHGRLRELIGAINHSAA